jgi:hypothetical protein
MPLSVYLQPDGVSLNMFRACAALTPYEADIVKAIAMYDRNRAGFLTDLQHVQHASKWP